MIKNSYFSVLMMIVRFYFLLLQWCVIFYQFLYKTHQSIKTTTTETIQVINSRLALSRSSGNLWRGAGRWIRIITRVTPPISGPIRHTLRTLRHNPVPAGVRPGVPHTEWPGQLMNRPRWVGNAHARELYICWFRIYFKIEDATYFQFFCTLHVQL